MELTGRFCEFAKYKAAKKSVLLGVRTARLCTDVKAIRVIVTIYSIFYHRFM